MGIKSYLRNSFASLSPIMTPRQRTYLAAAVVVEQFEQRLLMSVTATLSNPTGNVTTPVTSKVFDIFYSSTTPVNESTVGANNIVVTGPTALQVVSATIVNPGSDNNLDVRYTVSPTNPVSAFTAAQDGQYKVSVPGSAPVTDTNSVAVTANANLGTFLVNLPDNVPPQAISFTAPNPNPIVSTTTSTATVQVTYSDNVAVSVGSIAPGNISVTGPQGQTLNVTNAVANTGVDSKTIIATYTIQNPGGTWSTAANGTYTVNVLSSGTTTQFVTDTSANPVTAAPDFGAFQVAIPDNTPPQASNFIAAPVNAPDSGTESIQIEYTDDAGIAIGSIGTSNITVSGPQAVNVISAVPDQNTSGTPRFVTYTLQKASGTPWTAADNGTYTVSLVGGMTGGAVTVGSVTDTATPANPVAAIPSFGTFTVSIGDSSIPQVTGVVAPNITSLGGSTETIQVTYADDIAIAIGSIGINNITVIGPQGQTLPVIGAVPDQSSNGTPRTVTYTVQNPGGLWSAADNGTYTVSINANVTDTANPVNSIVALPNFATFTVDLPNTNSPQVSDFTAPDIASAGQATGVITITYTDAVAINTTTISVSNIKVIGPHGQLLQVLSAVPDNPADGTPRVVTYTFAAPDGRSFSNLDNGLYTVEVLSSVQNTSGLSVPAQTLTQPTSGATPFTFQVVIGTAAPIALPLGQFGNVNGTNAPLRFRDIPLGIVATLRLKGGVGTATLEANSGIVDLGLTDTGGGMTFTVTTSGRHPLEIGNLFAQGTLIKMTAKTTELRGTLYASGEIGSLSLFNVLGNAVSAGAMGTVKIGHSVTGAEILSGVNLGSDGLFGGTGTAADQVGPGAIGSITVTQLVSSSFVGAGINPGPDGIFGTADDTIIAGGASTIAKVAINDLDTTSRFEAGGFGIVRLRSRRISILAHPQFVVPPKSS